MRIGEKIRALVGGAARRADELRELAIQETRRRVQFDDAARRAALSEGLLIPLVTGIAGGSEALAVGPRGEGYDVRAPRRSPIRFGGTAHERSTPGSSSRHGSPRPFAPRRGSKERFPAATRAPAAPRTSSRASIAACPARTSRATPASRRGRAGSRPRARSASPARTRTGSSSD